MQPAQQALVGQIRLLGRGGARSLSTSGAAAAAASATVTLPNGKQPQDGGVKLRMPAEWEPHAGTWMAWPTRFDVWRDGARPARAAFHAVVSAISRFE
jgi:hypothetical protein